MPHAYPTEFRTRAIALVRAGNPPSRQLSSWASIQSPYANICEHCPNFRTDATYLPILAVQRTDARELAYDAQRRGWITEAECHYQLIAASTPPSPTSRNQPDKVWTTR
ncbi:hypothetical protein IRT45_30895 [Nocardia sp. BSTN01]|uniref:hypothetical protein n=1 Tax=Nocardia sp. BSTN01 TaxID=2783665 RepID=UPI00188DE4C1|nr:hypothetical protein [Nocardia sp. BSTN01]MBF5001541.1 hypothetical protein [Nocardia sp. BSTN01]